LTITICWLSAYLLSRSSMAKPSLASAPGAAISMMKVSDSAAGAPGR
jgi:hypothetical protein